MRVALVYDRVNKWGGAERVLLALHEIFPKAPLYTSVYDARKASWAAVFPQVVSSPLQKIPGANSRHEWLAPLMPVVFENFNFDNFDLVISVTSEAAKGIITKPKTRHICYCLTPTRYLWSHHDEYFKDGVFKDITKPIISYLQSWDKIAAQRPDEMVAISSAVKERIRKFYHRESEIIFPPVEMSSLKLSGASKRNYFLIVSRLVPYKKVDLAIEAFNQLGKNLIIAGIGSEERKLKAMAKENIGFLGFVKEKELTELYRNASGFICPQEEDFGITAVEAQALGCPVIAYKKGGSLDTVIEGKTGLFFENQTTQSLKETIKKFEKMKFNEKKLVENSQKFSKEKFEEKIMDIVKRKV